MSAHTTNTSERVSLLAKVEEVVTDKRAWFFVLEGIGARFWIKPDEPVFFHAGDRVKVVIEKMEDGATLAQVH